MIKIWQQYFALSSHPLIITSILGQQERKGRTEILLSTDLTWPLYPGLFLFSITNIDLVVDIIIITGFIRVFFILTYYHVMKLNIEVELTLRVRCEGFNIC